MVVSTRHHDCLPYEMRLFSTVLMSDTSPLHASETSGAQGRERQGKREKKERGWQEARGGEGGKKGDKKVAAGEGEKKGIEVGKKQDEG